MSRWLRWAARQWWINFKWLCSKEPIVRANIRLYEQCQEYKRDAVEGRL